MSGLTWARNEKDERGLVAGEMMDSFLKIKTEFEARHGKPLKAVRISRLTLLLIPTAVPMLSDLGADYSAARFYGVPVEIDDSLAPWQFKEVYA